MEQRSNESSINKKQSTVVILSRTTVRSIDDISKFSTMVPLERIIELIQKEEKRISSEESKKVEIAYT